MTPDTLIVVAALDEADRISATLAALASVFPGAPVWVADDGSTDATPELARAAGATVVRCRRGAPRRGDVVGKGQAMTAGVRAALASIDFFDGDSNGDGDADDDAHDEDGDGDGDGDGARAHARARTHARTDGDSEDSPAASEHSPAAHPTPSTADPIVVLCDGDLGDCARELSALTDAIRRGDADLAVAAFSTRATGGLGLALAFARWAVRRRCGVRARAPISGQRALRTSVLPDVLPFAPGFAMEIGMTIDAVRAGHRLLEIELPLSHRPTGRTLAGFVHRARQLVDFVRVYLARR